MEEVSLSAPEEYLSPKVEKNIYVILIICAIYYQYTRSYNMLKIYLAKYLQ